MHGYVRCSGARGGKYAITCRRFSTWVNSAQFSCPFFSLNGIHQIAGSDFVRTDRDNVGTVKSHATMRQFDRYDNKKNSEGTTNVKKICSTEWLQAFRVILGTKLADFGRNAAPRQRQITLFANVKAYLVARKTFTAEGYISVGRIAWSSLKELHSDYVNGHRDAEVSDAGNFAKRSTRKQRCTRACPVELPERESCLPNSR